MLRLVVSVVSMAGLLLACSADPYPFEPGPGASEFNPITVGQPVRAVIAYVQVRPGDQIELVGAEPMGSFDGASVRLWLSRPIIRNDGSRLIGENLEALPGSVIRAVSPSPGPANDVGIVGELTASRPGLFTVTSVRLQFRLNGGTVQTRDGISTLWTVCSDDPAPTDCYEGST